MFLIQPVEFIDVQAQRVRALNYNVPLPYTAA